MVLRLMVAAVLAGFAGLAHAEDRPVLKTDKDKVSYSIGLDIGTNFKRQSVDLDQKALAAGIADGMSGGKPLLTEDEVRKVLAQFQQQMAAKAPQNHPLARFVSQRRSGPQAHLPGDTESDR